MPLHCSNFTYFVLQIVLVTLNVYVNQSDDNLICLPTMRSINPFCFDAPLSLVSKDIGAIEVN